MNGRDFGVVFGLLAAVGFAFWIGFSAPRPNTIGTAYSIVLAHREQWNRSRPLSYAVTIERHCFCTPWSVRTVTSQTQPETSTYKHEPDYPGWHEDRRNFPLNIDDVFTAIDAAFASKAYRVDVTFDEEYGYPLKVSVDEEKNAIDDEYSITTEGFQPIHVG